MVFMVAALVMVLPLGCWFLRGLWGGGGLAVGFRNPMLLIQLLALPVLSVVFETVLGSFRGGGGGRVSGKRSKPYGGSPERQSKQAWEQMQNSQFPQSEAPVLWSAIVEAVSS